MPVRTRLLFPRMRAALPCLFAGLAACGGKGSDEWALPADPDPTPGITCGESTCQAPESCVLVSDGPRACTQLPDAGPDGEVCNGCVFASCDGPEDCPAGAACVVRADGIGLHCAPIPGDACTRDRPVLACHKKSDCPDCFFACAGAGTSLPGASDSLQYGLCAHAP
jgi:hypothetical protein